MLEVVAAKAAGGLGGGGGSPSRLSPPEAPKGKETLPARHRRHRLDFDHRHDSRATQALLWMLCDTPWRLSRLSRAKTTKLKQRHQLLISIYSQQGEGAGGTAKATWGREKKQKQNTQTSWSESMLERRGGKKKVTPRGSAQQENKRGQVRGGRTAGGNRSSTSAKSQQVSCLCFCVCPQPFLSSSVRCSWSASAAVLTRRRRGTGAPGF